MIFHVLLSPCGFEPPPPPTLLGSSAMRDAAHMELRRTPALPIFAALPQLGSPPSVSESANPPQWPTDIELPGVSAASAGNGGAIPLPQHEPPRLEARHGLFLRMGSVDSAREFGLFLAQKEDKGVTVVSCFNSFSCKLTQDVSQA